MIALGASLAATRGRSAWAEDVGPAAEQRSGTALFDAARQADDAGDYEAALDGYRAAVAADPSARYAARAMARARALEALVTDPALTGLSDLRRDYPTLGSAAAVARAESLLEAATTVDGRIAVHWWLANEHALVTLDHGQAVAHFLAAATDPAAPPGTVESALLLAGRAADTHQRLRQVVDTIATVGAARSDLDPTGIRGARDEAMDRLHRKWARPAAVVAVVLLAALAAGRRRWRGLSQLGAGGPAAVTYAFVGAAALSHFWEDGYVLPFLCAAVAVAFVHVLSVCARADERAPTANRASTGMLVALATVGAIYLVFDAFGRQAVFGL